MTYLITNRLQTSLVIADISLRLDPFGTATVAEQTYLSSKQIHEYENKKWVSIAVRSAPPPKPPIPLWPFSAAPAVVPVTPAPPPTESVLASLVSRLEGLIGNLHVSPTAPVAITAPAAAVVALIPQPSDEPMFIPSQIIPTTADVNIQVAKSETDRQDYDAGLEALKKARRK